MNVLVYFILLALSKTREKAEVKSVYVNLRCRVPMLPTYTPHTALEE